MFKKFNKEYTKYLEKEMFCSIDDMIDKRLYNEFQFFIYVVLCRYKWYNDIIKVLRRNKKDE